MENVYINNASLYLWQHRSANTTFKRPETDYIEHSQIRPVLLWSFDRTLRRPHESSFGQSRDLAGRAPPSQKFPLTNRDTSTFEIQCQLIVSVICVIVLQSV